MFGSFLITYWYPEYTFKHTQYFAKGKWNMNNQISALVNYSTYCSCVNYDDYVKNIYGTLKYLEVHYNSSCLENKIMLKSRLSFISMQQLFDNLKDQPNEKLFRKYLEISANDSLVIKNHNVYLNNIRKIKHRTFDKLEIVHGNKHNQSLEFYMSNITCDDWMDVISENKCFGVMYNICCPKATKLGHTYENITIKECSNTLMTTDEVLKFQNKYIDENGKFDMGFANTSMIFGPGIGNGNSVLPIYINKYHWLFAKHYIEENISLAVTQNSFSFCKNMLYVYPQILMNYILSLETLSNKDFHLFINIYVTIQELHKIYGRFDNNYKCFFTSLDATQLSTHLNNALITYVMYCQNNAKSTFFFSKIYEEKVRREIDKCHNITQYFRHYTINKLMLVQLFADYKEIQQIYKFMNVRDEFNLLVNEFKTNSGIILDDSITKFKKNFTDSNTYDYCEQIKTINPSLNNNIIIDCLFLQSYITRKNKKRILSYSSKYKCIHKNSVYEIQENNKLILSLLTQHT